MKNVVQDRVSNPKILFLNIRFAIAPDIVWLSVIHTTTTLVEAAGLRARAASTTHKKDPS
jgi:hypothetical protein